MLQGLSFVTRCTTGCSQVHLHLVYLCLYLILNSDLSVFCLFPFLCVFVSFGSKSCTAADDFFDKKVVDWFHRPMIWWRGDVQAWSGRQAEILLLSFVNSSSCSNQRRSFSQMKNAGCSLSLRSVDLLLWFDLDYSLLPTFVYCYCCSCEATSIKRNKWCFFLVLSSSKGGSEKTCSTIFQH